MGARAEISDTCTLAPCCNIVFCNRFWSREGGFITASWIALEVSASRVIGAP